MKDISPELLDRLFSCAMHRCGKIADAEDLVQDTVLSYLTALSQGKVIDKPESWLYSVLNRKFYDRLRRKYKLPVVSVDMGDSLFSDIADDYSLEDSVLQTDMTEPLRRELAYLSGLYREIIVRHYFRGEKLADIADAMKIPLGTVKSRLSFARSELKKGIETMENYTENSYAPREMYLRHSGGSGIHDEPMSLVPDDDILAQNLLLLAYEKPVTISELSHAIGIPSAYIEPTIRKLVDGELMCSAGGGKVYTDFVIYEPDEYIKYRKEQEDFADQYTPDCLPIFQEALANLGKTGFSGDRLERYFAIDLFARAAWNTVCANLKPQVFPDRPNGGRWIAFGECCHPDGYEIPAEQCGRHLCGYSGERWEVIENYRGFRQAMIRNYETPLYPYDKYGGFQYSSFTQLESDVLRLLCLAKQGGSPEDMSHEMLQYLPLMEKNGMISCWNGKPEVLVPFLTMEQYRQYETIRNEAVSGIIEILKTPMAEFLRGKKKQLPAHLKNSRSIPEAKLYMPYAPNGMIFVWNMIDMGIIPGDLGVLCPETIVITE